MIVLDDERLLFLQVPQTGCTAVGKELVERYGGRQVGRKHDHLAALPAAVRSELSSYTVVCSVRDPLAIEMAAWRKAENLTNGWKPENRIAKGTIERSEAAVDGVDARNYLVSRYWRPAIDTWVGDRSRCDLVMTQANLVEDFESMMAMVGRVTQRPLPSRNVTGNVQPSLDLPPKWLAYVFGPQRRSIGIDGQLDLLPWPLRALCIADHALSSGLLRSLGRFSVNPGGSVTAWSLRLTRLPLAPLHAVATFALLQPWRDALNRSRFAG